jgi:predicted branched-subunit amino acid permease
MLANARFLPMTLTLMPLLRDRSHPQWRYYFAAHLIAMTSWAVCMRRFPAMPRAERLSYLAGFTLTCMAVSLVAVVTGYLIAGSIPAPIQIGLLFLTPVYFCVLLIGEAQGRLAAIALACGGLAGPLFYLLSPQWSVLLAGFAGGSVAFAIHKALRKSRA